MSAWIFKLFGVAIIAVLLLVVLKKESPDIALTAKMCAGVILAVGCIASMSPIVEYVEQIGESLGADEALGSSVEVLLKALGVSILAHITSTVCKDAGEGSVAYYVELGGKIEIMLISLPLLKELIEVALELLEMS